MNNQRRHNLVVTRPVCGERVRLRSVPTKTAINLALSGVARFEDQSVQREIDDIRQVFAGDCKPHISKNELRHR
jgi:hypothetical protein